MGPFRKAYVAAISNDARLDLLRIAEAASFRDLLPGQAKISDLRGIVRALDNGNVLVPARTTGLLNLASRLRRIVLIGQPALGERLNLQRVGLGTVGVCQSDKNRTALSWPKIAPLRLSLYESDL